MSLTTRLSELNECLANDGLLGLYGSAEAFLSAFSPASQADIVENERLCVFGPYPTLGQLNTAYREKVAQKWLVDQILQMSYYFGVKGKLDDAQLYELAIHIYMDFKWLKVSDLMLFFWLAKKGRFGEFFGQIDPPRITAWLCDFVDGYRNDIIRSAVEEITCKYEKWYRDSAVKDRDLNKELLAILEGRDKQDGQHRVKPTRKADAAVLESALTLVRNTNGYGEDVLAKMCKAWERRYGITPQDYVSNFNNEEE